MAEAVLLKSADVWLGGYDLSGDLDRIEMLAAKAEKANNRMGDGMEAFYPGLQQITADLGGFWAAGAGLIDPVAWGQIDPSLTPEAWPLTVNPPYAPAATPGTEGNTGYTITGRQFRYRGMGGQHGELMKYDLSTKPSSTYQLVRHTVIAPRATRTVTTNGTAFQLGILAAGQRLVVAYHVFAIVGGTWTLTIQSDNAAGFPSPTTRATAAATTTAPGRQVLHIDGPIATDDHWRAVMTKGSGTSLTYAVVAGIVTI